MTGLRILETAIPQFSSIMECLPRQEPFIELLKTNNEGSVPSLRETWNAGVSYEASEETKLGVRMVRNLQLTIFHTSDTTYYITEMNTIKSAYNQFYRTSPSLANTYKSCSGRVLGRVGICIRIVSHSAHWSYKIFLLFSSL